MRAFRLLPVFLLLALSLVEAQSVYLHKAAFLSKESFTLGELATVVAPDPLLESRLRSLELGASPRAMALFPLAEIRRRIEQAFSGQVDLIGSRVSLIPAGAAPEGQQWFFERLLAFLDEQDGGMEGRLEIELVSQPQLRSAQMEAGTVEFFLQQSRRAQNRLAGAAQVSFRISGKAAMESGILSIWVHHFLPVARAARNLKAGEPLTEREIEYTVEDISLLSGKFLAAGDAIGSVRTTAPISQGALIDPGRLVRHYLVKAGDTVTVVFLRPGLSVSLPGKAYGSGSQGDTVEVRPLVSQKRFSGRISDSGEVLVERL